MPAPVTEFLVKHTGAVKRLYSERKAQEEERLTGGAENSSTGQPEEADEHEIEAEDSSDEGGQQLSMADFKQGLAAAFANEKSDREVWKDAVEKITSFGPRRVGPNVLIDATQAGICGKL